MNTTCEGKLRHCFFGTYSAVVALAFDSPEHARDALRTLGGAWKEGERSPSALVWSGDRAELDALKLQFTRWNLTISPCGRSHCRNQCKGESIDSVAHSIDHGPTFRLTIPTVPAEQQILF